MSHITRGSDENKADWDFKEENGIWPWQTGDAKPVSKLKRKRRKKQKTKSKK